MQLSIEQLKALQDLNAFIEFGINEDLSFYQILGTVMHDARGLFDENKNFLAKSSGYSKK